MWGSSSRPLLHRRSLALSVATPDLGRGVPPLGRASARSIAAGSRRAFARSIDHYIYYCGQESLRRNGIAIMVNKRVQNAVLGCNLKNNRMISVRFQGKPFNITVIQAYAPTSSAEERFYEDLQDLLELTPKKDVLFIIGDWNAKVGSQETLGVTGRFGLGVRNEAGQRLIEFCQENALVIANTFFQHTREDITTHGHHQMVNTEIKLIIFFAAKDGEKKLYTVSKNKTRSRLWLRS